MKPHAALAAENGVDDRHRKPHQQPHRYPGLPALAGRCIRNLPGIGIALAPYHLPQDTKLLADLIAQCDKS
jgi:hypothetical protein